MSGILEIIFQGFLEWAYTLILEIWEFFSTALLNIMSMDFAYLQSRIPILPVLQQSFLAVGWALLIGNLVFQSVRSMLSGLGFDAEDPKLLFSRTFVFSFLLVASPQICDIALNMTAAVIRMMEMPNAVAITTLSEGAFAGLGTAWLLVIICGVVVMYQSIKLFVEMAERYFILCMLTITSPMAFGLGGSRSTSDIFTHWCRMYGSMCLLMVMNVVFIKILMSVLAYSPTGPDVLPWMVLVMAVVRTAKKFDSIISRLGLNPAITNEPRVPGMLSLIVARTMMSNAAKVISQNGAQGAGHSGGSGPPPGGAGGGRGSGGENRNDRRDFNNNRNADKSGQRNQGEERDRRGRNRNGASPTPDGAPSAGGKGGGQRDSNPRSSDAKRGSGGGQNRDAGSSGAKKKGGGQRETDGAGKGYRRNSGESGGAQRNRSYRNPNAPPDSPPESGRDASRSSRQESGRQSSSGQFDRRRSSSQTSFTRNGDGVPANGGGQFPREQGFTEKGRRDASKTSAPRSGQPSPVRSETRAPDSAPVSRTATGNPAERASSGAAPKKGGSDRGRSMDGQSGRYSERPQEKTSRQTPGGAPPPSSSQTRTDGVSHSGVTESRAERTSATTRADVSSKDSGRTSVTDSRFTQRGDSASQVKAKDGAVTPQSDAAYTPPHTPPETPPRNVTSPVTQEKASPDKETASGSSETRFSNRSASSSTTTATASSTANKSGAESRKVPPPDEKPGFGSADTRFTARPVSPTANPADSAQSHAEGRTTSVTSKPDAAPRNVTAPAPQGTVTLDKDKETVSASEDTRFTNRAAFGDAASASQNAASVSQMSASASGAAPKGVVPSDKKEAGSNSGETRFTNRNASKDAVSASQTSATANGAAPKSADSSDKKETASNSGETRFSNRTASQDAASVSQTSAVTSGATSKSVISSDRKDASANSEDTRFTSRSASSNAPPASAGASGATSKSGGVPSDKKETTANPGDARFSNRAAPGNAIVTSQTSTVTNSAPSDKETASNSEETRFTNRSASYNAPPASAIADSATSRSVTPPDKEATSNSKETRFSNRAASQTPTVTSGVTSKGGGSSDKETTSNSEETRFSNRTASQTPAAASGVTSDKEATSNAEETRFSNRTASQMSTATNGAVSSDKKEAGSNSRDTRFSNRAAPGSAASSSQTSAAKNGVHTDNEMASHSEETRFSNRAASQTSAVTGGVTSRSVSPSDKETTSNPEETRFSNRTASQTSVTVNGTASKSVIPTDRKETFSDSGESRFTNRPVSSDAASAPPAVANGVNAQGSSSKSSKDTDSVSGETRFTSRPISGNAVPAPPASATVSTASSNGTEATRHSGESRFTNRVASGDTSLPPQTSTAMGGGASNGVPPPDRNTDSDSDETRFTSRSVSGNALSAPPTPTVTSGGTSKIVPSPGGETASDSGDSRFSSRPVSTGANAVSAALPPAAASGSGSKDSSTVKETNSDSVGTRFTSRPASPVAADGGTSTDRFSAVSNRTPEHTGATESRAVVTKPDNAGTPDAKSGTQVVVSQTGAPPSPVVSSRKADSGVTESRFSQRDSAKMTGQSHTDAPATSPASNTENSRGGMTDGASALDTRQSARELRERVPAVTPSDSAKSAPARPERGETSGQSVVTTATPGHASSAVPRPAMSGGGSEQSATRQSARESAGQNNGRTDNGASETSAAKAETTLSHPATVPPRVGGGNQETPTRPDRPGTEKRSPTVSETSALRQHPSRSGADSSMKPNASDEKRASAKQPDEFASAVSQRPPTFNNNATPPPVTRETAAGYAETQRQPRRNADVTPRPVTPSGASEQRENPTRRGEQPPRKMYASGNGVPTRPNAERTERRADQFGERPQTSGQRSYPPNREQRTSQTVRDSDNHSVPVRSATGTANRADSARQRTRDSSERRAGSPDTAAGQQSGRSNQTRTPPGMYAPDNGAPARPGRGTTERNDARRPAGQPQRNANAVPRPSEQQRERRAPDTRDAEGHDRVPILNGAAGKRDSATRPSPGRGKSAVPPPGRYYDAEWRSVPAGRENGTPQTPPRNGKEAPRGGVTENGRPKTPSASKEGKRPLFDFFGFGGGKRK